MNDEQRVYRYILYEFGLPDVAVYSDGRVVDLKTNRELGTPESRAVVLPSEGGRMHLSRSKLLGYCFSAPWVTGERYVNLSFIGFPGYNVTYDGRVFGERNMEYLEPRVTRDGYYTVGLYDSNLKVHRVKIHRLVASAFIPNPKNKPAVNHINGKKWDNCVDNLEWVTEWENIHHATTHGLRPGTSEEDVVTICKLLEQGVSQTETAKRVGVGRHIVKDIQYGGYYNISRNFKIPRYTSQKRKPKHFDNE